MPYYKLTNKDMKTYGGCQWVIGEQKRTSGEGELCSRGWLHCYDSPSLAVLLNPVHANIKSPRMFRVKVAGKKKTDHGLQFGFTCMTLVEEIEVPSITTGQHIAFGVLCTREVYQGVLWETVETLWKLWDFTWGDESIYKAMQMVVTSAREKKINLKNLAKKAMEF